MSEIQIHSYFLLSFFVNVCKCFCIKENEDESNCLLTFNFFINRIEMLTTDS